MRYIRKLVVPHGKIPLTTYRYAIYKVNIGVFTLTRNLYFRGIEDI